MATQLLGGLWAQRRGGKAVVSAALLWFSAATILAPAALSSKLLLAGASLPLLLLARVLVGLGEGVVLPSVTTLLGQSVPPQRRTQAVGGVFAGFHWRAHPLAPICTRTRTRTQPAQPFRHPPPPGPPRPPTRSGTILGLLASPLLIEAVGWRAMFAVYGLVGLPLWALWQARERRGGALSLATCRTSARRPCTRLTGGRRPPSGAGAGAPSWRPRRRGRGCLRRRGQGRRRYPPLQPRRLGPPRPTAPPSTPVHPLSHLPHPATRLLPPCTHSPAALPPSACRQQSTTNPPPNQSTNHAQAIIVANVVNHFNYFIYLNWLPAFFHNAMGLNVRSSALFTFLPWVAMARNARSTRLFPLPAPANTAAPPGAHGLSALAVSAVSAGDLLVRVRVDRGQAHPSLRSRHGARAQGTPRLPPAPPLPPSLSHRAAPRRARADENPRNNPRAPGQTRKALQSIAFLGPCFALWPLAHPPSASAPERPSRSASPLRRPPARRM